MFKWVLHNVFLSDFKDYFGLFFLLFIRHDSSSENLCDKAKASLHEAPNLLPTDPNRSPHFPKFKSEVILTKLKMN